jgi:pyruvate dehydrogenase E2 component (dihydrolipoamide acetyltransferase)
MATPIVMPSFGMYTTDGILSSWLCSDGVYVEAGQSILEIETEKAIQEVPAPASGLLHHLLSEGSVLSVEALMGYVLADGEEPPAEQPCSSLLLTTEAFADQLVAHSSPSDPPASFGAFRGSPIARRLALEHGIDLACLKGSGPGGRILEKDVLAEVERRS